MKAFDVHSVGRQANDGVTLFRCCLMFLVVLHHAICYSSRSQTTAWTVLWLLTVPAVDGFLSISGWYGVRFSWKKVGNLFGQIVFYAALSSALSFPLAHYGTIPAPLVAVGNAWYGIAYLALLCLCPLLNAGIETLRQKDAGFRAAALILLVLVVDWASRAFHLGLSVNGFGSHTLATFVAIYCGIGLLKPVLEKHLRSAIAIGVLNFVVYEILFVMRAAHIGVHYVVDVVGEFGFYNCPLVICSALAGFLFFSKAHVPAWTGRILRFLAPSMFAVYLISDASPVFKNLFVNKVIVPYGVVTGAVGVFVICILLDLLVRRLPIWVIRKGLAR